MTAQILHGNNLDILPTLADCSVDSIVTDPPYELGFMGKQWDATGIAYNVQLWRECLRVLKPGGHLLAFGGTRTYHRMAVAIEDAGFEIRDSIHWIYGSGFPKSLDVSKAIDKAAGAEREVVGTKRGTAADPSTGRSDMPGKAVGVKQVGIDVPVTNPATAAAKQWDGWGTALKPAHEPIVLARKPLVGTVANNVLTHGTGALNIDGCRIDMGDEYDPSKIQRQQHSAGSIEGAFSASALIGKEIATYKPGGRWPANVIHDGSNEVIERFPNSKGGAYPTQRSPAVNTAFGEGQPTPGGPRQMGDDGSAARFFAATPYTDLDGDSFIYCPKPGRKERNAGLDHLDERIVNEVTPPGTKGSNSPRAGAGRNGATQNFHPTVKPLALMRYLIRLVTPPGGTVLEPFAGSGTTLAAATLENLNSIGIELTADYLPIIKARIAWAEQQTENEAPTLFST